MHRSMIPPPPGHDPNNDPQFFENWKKHIRKTLHDNNYFGLDRQWIKKVSQLGGSCIAFGQRKMGQENAQPQKH